MPKLAYEQVEPSDLNDRLIRDIQRVTYDANREDLAATRTPEELLQRFFGQNGEMPDADLKLYLRAARKGGLFVAREGKEVIGVIAVRKEVSPQNPGFLNTIVRSGKRAATALIRKPYVHPAIAQFAVEPSRQREGHGSGLVQNRQEVDIFQSYLLQPRMLPSVPN